MQVLLHPNMNETHILRAQKFQPSDISVSVWQCCAKVSFQSLGRLNEWPQQQFTE